MFIIYHCLFLSSLSGYGYSKEVYKEAHHHSQQEVDQVTKRCKNTNWLPCISSESHPITMIAWGCSQIFSELDIPKVVKNWIKPWKSEGLSSKICPRVVLRVIILTWGAQPLKESLIIWNPEDVPLLFRLLDKKNQRVCGPEQCMTNIQMYLNIQKFKSTFVSKK